MKLQDIVKDIDNGLNIAVRGATNMDIKGISNDSRKVKAGYIFAARKGTAVNSNIYLLDAVSNGAVAILINEIGKDDYGKLKDKNITIILAQDALKVYASISKNFFKNPSQKMCVIGVTGTNGKTTTTFLIKSILTNAGNGTGLLGTIGYETGGNAISSGNTTPDAYILNKIMNDMVSFGITHCVMEVSSHGLVQDRIYGIACDVAIFTNLTRDHLDYHKDMEDYYQAKKTLFSEILLQSDKSKKFAVINNDDFYGKRLIKELRKEMGLSTDIKIITYGIGGNSDISAEGVSYSKDGLKFNVILPSESKKLNISSKLIGTYNVYNILAACSAAYALSVHDDYIVGGVKDLTNVPGRVERINIKDTKTPLICVDYAHTDDALERILSTLRKIGSGRLISVFGCGGDRDKGKRPLMGKHSTDIADITIITSDNPRNEEQLSIIREIEIGIGDAVFIDFLNINFQEAKNKIENIQGKHIYTILKDRSVAIRAALSISEIKDIVLIAGKGHEDYMIIKENKHHFSDKEEVLKFYEDRI